MSGPGERRRVMAEFATAADLLGAVVDLRDHGYQELETYTPYPLAEIESRLARRRSRLPWIVFAGGVIGALLSYAVQWYANVVQYPLNAGGRPVHAVPAFLLSTFEGMVLAAAVTAFLAFLITLRLPRLWHPVFEIDGFERASVDRFWIEIDQTETPFGLERPEPILKRAGALRVVHVEAAE